MDRNSWFELKLGLHVETMKIANSLLPNNRKIFRVLHRTLHLDLYLISPTFDEKLFCRFYFAKKNTNTNYSARRLIGSQIIESAAYL